MPTQMPKVASVELNHQTNVLLNTTPTAPTGTYASLCNAFKNVAYAMNEVVYSASYLSDEGYSSSAVTGFAPTLTLQGDFMANDPVCAYLDAAQWETGAGRVTDVKLSRNGRVITCPVTMTQILIAGGEATAPNSVTLTLTFNGRPTVTAGTLSSDGNVAADTNNENGDV